MNTNTTIIALFLCTAPVSAFAADSSNYTIVPFDYMRDGKATLQLLVQNSDEFFVSSSEEKACSSSNSNQNNNINTKDIDRRLKNNMPLSDVKPKLNTYSRALLCIIKHHSSQGKYSYGLIGIIDFFIAEEDNTGRMETLSIVQGHALVACRTRLINHALQKLHDLGAQRVIIDVAENDPTSANLFKALNFFPITQNSSDIEYKVVRFVRDISKLS